MKGQLQIYYDEEGDFLEINIGSYTKGYFKDVGDGVAERIDEKTGKITGIAILSFKFEFHLVFRRWMPITNSQCK